MVTDPIRTPISGASVAVIAVDGDVDAATFPIAEVFRAAVIVIATRDDIQAEASFLIAGPDGARIMVAAVGRRCACRAKEVVSAHGVAM